MENYNKFRMKAMILYHEAQDAIRLACDYAKDECYKAGKAVKAAEKAYFAAEESGATDEECDRLADEYSNLMDKAREWADEVDFLESKLG